MTKNFTKKAKDAIESAKAHAEKLGHTYIGSEHILLGIMCTECVASRLLDDKKILYTDIYDSIIRISGAGTNAPLLYCSFTPKCKRILEASGIFAEKLGGGFIGTEHILHALCENPDSVGARILSSLGINLQSLKGEIYSFLESSRDSVSPSKGSVQGAPTLSQYGVSLTALAKNGSIDPVSERDGELTRVIQILTRRQKNNPCLVGEPGVGKTAIAEGLAIMIAEGRVPECLSDKIIFSLDLSSMVAGAKYRGEFEERMRLVLNEVKANRSIILFIDEIHTLIGAGSAEGAVDAANIIKPALARGAIRVIGATTLDEYRQHIERDPALERRFQPVTVDEPDSERAFKILKSLKGKYEEHHGVKIEDEVLRSAVSLSVRYITDRFLPDKAIDLIDEACSSKKLSRMEKSPHIRSEEEKIKELEKEKENAILSEDFEAASRIRDEELKLKISLNKLKAEYYSQGDSAPAITEADLRNVISLWTGVPVSDLSKNERERLVSLENELNTDIIGQEEAVRLTVGAIKRGRLGLKDPDRPIASIMLLGPTGVGKTALALSLAKHLYTGRDSLIRLDMSEYSERHSVSKLIGSPPGYVGYGEGGALTEAVRRRPYSVILLDEIEKAHADVYGMLLQILDDGALTDSRQRRVDFRNCVIIMTSNLGARFMTDKRRSGFTEAKADSGSVRGEINTELKNHFSPEFLNRLDEVVIFNKLDFSGAEKITRKLLDGVRRIASDMNISLVFDEGLAGRITELGYDKSYGARPLKRTITSYIENPLADRMLLGEIKSGDTVRVSYDTSVKFSVM